MMFAMVFLTVIEKRVATLSIQFSNFAWSLDSAGDNVKSMILENSERNNKMNNIVLLLAASAIVINLPIWADQNELFLFGQVFEYFFGKFSIIPYVIYSATMPYVCYACFRLAFVFLYLILHVQVQVFLLSEGILQISDDFKHLEDLDKIRNVLYQKTMHKKLCFYIQQHCELNRFFFKLTHQFNLKNTILQLRGKHLQIGAGDNANCNNSGRTSNHQYYLLYFRREINTCQLQPLQVTVSEFSHHE
jgi:hypothetical protein